MLCVAVGVASQTRLAASAIGLSPNLVREFRPQKGGGGGGENEARIHLGEIKLEKSVCVTKVRTVLLIQNNFSLKLLVIGINPSNLKLCSII